MRGRTSGSSNPYLACRRLLRRAARSNRGEWLELGLWIALFCLGLYLVLLPGDQAFEGLKSLLGF